MTDTQPYGRRAAHRAAELTERSQATLDASTGTPVSWAPIGSAMVVALALWLWCTKPLLHLPYTGEAWNTATRDEGVAALVLLAGLVLWFRPRNTVAAAVAVLGGLALVAFGLWADHEVQRSAVNEVLTGIAVVVGATAAKARRRR